MGPALQHSVDCADAVKGLAGRLTEVGGEKSSRELAANPWDPERVRPARFCSKAGLMGRRQDHEGRTSPATVAEKST